MSVHLVVIPSPADADTASRRLWTQFALDQTGTTHALDIVEHPDPDDGRIALRLPDGWGFDVDQSRDPASIDLGPNPEAVLTDPADAIATVLASPRLTAATMRSLVKPELLLTESEARDQGWFPEPENP